MTERDPFDTFGAADDPRETAAAVAEKPVEDKRQRWTCVTPEGPRTTRRPGGTASEAVVCAVFHSDDHLAKRMVVCPTCGGTSVRHAFDGEQ